MNKYPLSIVFFAFLIFISACKTAYQPAKVYFADYRVSSKQTGDKALVSLLQPYSDSINKTMNDVIAVAGMELDKKQPEGKLNNILADAMLDMAKEKYKSSVDAAFVNYGGIRLNSLPAGNITRGKIFEVAPFDNIIVLQKIKGIVLQHFLDITASKGGWPCAGISYQIKNKKAINTFIDGKLLIDSTEYTIAMLNYVANGGDNCEMLKTIPQQNNGYLFRDAVIDYFLKLHNERKQITGQIEKRVTNAE